MKYLLYIAYVQITLLCLYMNTHCFAYYIYRPFHSQTRHQKEGEFLIPLWTALRRLHRTFMLPKSKVANFTAQHTGENISSKQSRSLNCSASNSLLMERTNCMMHWSRNPDELSISGILDNPHTFLCLIRAEIWLAPDNRYFTNNYYLYQLIHV